MMATRRQARSSPTGRLRLIHHHVLPLPHGRDSLAGLDRAVEIGFRRTREVMACIFDGVAAISWTYGWRCSVRRRRSSMARMVIEMPGTFELRTSLSG